MFNSNSNSNFIMFTVYYRDLCDSHLFHLQATFDDFSTAFDFYNIEYAGYIKDLSNDKIVFSCNS